MATSPTTSIVNHHQTNTYTAYDVTCFNHRVRTIVTRDPTVVTSWINHIRSIHHPSIIGLDTEWLNPIATLQLCVGPNCLIYQLIHSGPTIPSALEDFLGDPQCNFSGVGISSDSQRLLKDYNLRLSSMVDVSKVAAEAGRVRVNAGLKEVAIAVLGWEMVKSKEITMSNWKKEVLEDRQVMYACLDAFVSYHIGKELLIGQNINTNHNHCVNKDDYVNYKVFGELEAKTYLEACV